MNCEKAQTWIDAYVDGELDVPAKALIEAHLETCPGCREQLRRVRHVTALSQSFEAVPPEGLLEKTRFGIADRKSTPMSRIKEKLTMKQGIGMRVGIATVAIAAILGAVVTLTPRPAEARGGAAAVLKKMKAAAAEVKAMHSISFWDDIENKPRIRIEIWTDGKDLYIDRGGHLEIIRHGKFYEGGKPFDYQKYLPDGTMVASGPVDPAMFTVSTQLKMLNRSGADPIDAGTATFQGRTVRKITITTDDGQERHTFWVDAGSDLPLRDSVEHLENGDWVESGYTDYEFIDALDPKLFDNLPPQVGG